MLAITPTGLANDDMVDQSTPYYQDVLCHFKPFANEPIIKTFDSLLTASLYNYIFITGNAMTYDLSGTSLKRNAVYVFPSRQVANKTINVNPLDTYRTQIAEFAKTSKFQKFYAQHRAYYTKLINEYESEASLAKQWKWLETNFKTRINNYLILCSPLINGMNYTTVFRDKGFTQILMVLPPLEHDAKRSKIQEEIFNTRVMFTEIDHNYVGPPSYANEKVIDSVFKKRADWVNEKADGIYAYPTPMKVFNEYMTFGVFLLYCHDHYERSLYDQTREEVISVMGARGFIRMATFTSALEKVRAYAPAKKIDDLYPELLRSLAQKAP